MSSLAAQFNDLHWFRLRAVFVCTRAEPKKKAHPFSVFEAIVKGVTLECFGAEAEPLVFFHLPGARRNATLKKEDRIALEILLCKTSREAAERWRSTLLGWFADGGKGRNFAIASTAEIERRSLADLLEERGELAGAGELCLVFFSPLPFSRTPGKPRSFIAATDFAALVVKRLSRVLGKKLRYASSRDDFALLPYYWDFIEIGHASRSQPGQTQRIKGCAGKLYLKGSYRDFLPFLLLAGELHAGDKLSNSQGYFQILAASPAYFSPAFPNRQAILSACRDVLERYDNAAAALSDAPADRFDEEAFAAELERDIRTGAYLPAPSTAFRIREKDGGDRLVEQLAYRDLIVQQYLLKTISRIFDRMFEEGSVGYRKGYSRQRAAEMIRSAIADGYRFALESDIDDFFPTIAPDKLEALLDFYLPAADTLIRELIGKSLRNGYALNGKLFPRVRGLAMGSPLSPLLANLYLDAFDEKIQSFDVRLVRYADDFVILARTREAAEAILLEGEAALGELGLGINKTKTGIRRAEDGFSFLGVRFDGSAAEPEPDVDYRRLKKPLYVTEPYLFLGVNGGALDVKRGGQIVDSIPLRRISEVMVLGKAVFSSALIGKCVAMGIPFTLASGTGYYMTTVKPDSKRFFATAHQHAAGFAALSETEKLTIAQEFAANKILNYIPLFRQRYAAGTNAFIKELEETAEQARRAGTVDEVRGYEGAAAKRIYRQLSQLTEPEAFRFKRRKRTDPDRMNSLLNFGYYLLFTRINATVRAAGLNPYLGFLHSERDDYESLVCDVEELFRSRIDRFLLRLVNLKMMTEADFTRTDKGMYMRHEASKKFVLEFEAEMERKSGAESLSLKESIYVQIRVLKNWATGEGGLSFYEWKMS